MFLNHMPGFVWAHLSCDWNKTHIARLGAILLLKKILSISFVIKKNAYMR